MRIKLDENMPFRLVNILNQMGHNTETVSQEGLAGQDDEKIWEIAQVNKEFLITQDLDFSDIRRFRPGNHYGLLLVRLINPGRDSLLQRVQTIFQTEQVDNWQGCFVVATEHKLRIRYPKK